MSGSAESQEGPPEALGNGEDTVQEEGTELMRSGKYQERVQGRRGGGLVATGTGDSLGR